MRANTPTAGMWLAIALEWSFLALLAYHLFLQHRAHVMGALPYVLVLVLLLAQVPAVILVARRRHKHAR